MVASIPSTPGPVAPECLLKPGANSLCYSSACQQPEVGVQEGEQLVVPGVWLRGRHKC